MSETGKCSACGAPIPTGSEAGQCIACLFDLADRDGDGDGDGQETRSVTASEPTAVLDSPAVPRERSFGDYELLEELGHGGMGVVYRARQRSLQRLVALKLIKAGLDSRQVLLRFEAERQALALMDHPNIARVFDAGRTVEGWPYFVMELVEGVPITLFCDEQRLNIHQRLELFARVCHAIQHAHQKGVIHRDIKPGNVLVTMRDGRPVPKVIDFGIAKAIGPRLTEETVNTEIGAVLGTLQYMSPEQAGLNQIDIDTRSDIYSLGILLYELLTGTTPLDRNLLKKAAFDELLRRIREEDPPKPSTRLGDSQETLAAASAHRRLDPVRLTRLLRGDVDWIVMKALEKDRNRRYATANALAQDIHRHLRQEPIQARPVGAAERTWRWCRRKPLVASLAATVVLSLLAVTVGSVVAAIRIAEARQRERSQRQIAEANEKQAKAAFGFLQDMFQSINPEGGDGAMITLKQVLDAKEPDLEAHFQGQPGALLTLHKLLGFAYGRLHEKPKARRHLESALSLQRSLISSNDLETAEMLEELAFVTGGTEATTNRALALAIRRQLQGTNDPAYLRAKANQAGGLIFSKANLSQGEEIIAQVLALPGETTAQAHQRVENDLRRAGELWASGQAEGARALVRADTERFLASPITAQQAPSFLVELGDRERDIGHTNVVEPLMLEGLSLARSHLDPLDPQRALVCMRVGQWLRSETRHAEAEAVLRESWQIRTNKLGHDHELTLAAGLLLADSLLHLGRTNEADAWLGTLPARRTNTLDAADLALRCDCASVLARLWETGWFRASSSQEQPILVRAARRDNAAIVRALVRSGASVEGTDKDGNTALIWAASAGKTNALSALLDCGARANAARPDGLTALHAAARQGHVNVARILLEHGADPHKTITRGSTPLHLAAQDDRPDMVRFLIGRGVSANDTGGRSSTPLHEAAFHARLGSMVALLEAGASVNATNSAGYTPLHVAAGTNHAECARLLLAHGANPNGRDSKGQTPLHHSVARDTDAVLELLLKAGARPTEPDIEGQTALHLAASREATNAIRLLLAAGADPSLKTPSGQTPLQLAEGQGHTAAASLLRSAASQRPAAEAPR